MTVRKTIKLLLKHETLLIPIDRVELVQASGSGVDVYLIGGRHLILKDLISAAKIVDQFTNSLNGVTDD